VQADRERLTQLLFEQFNVAGVFMCEQSILSLYSIGKTSGTVVDLGHGKIGILLLHPDQQMKWLLAQVDHLTQ